MAITTKPRGSRRDEVVLPPTQLLIDGEFVDSLDDRRFATIDPATEETIAEVAQASAPDVDRAVLAARRALGPWSSLDARERGRYLTRWADLIEAHQEELGRLESLDNGKPLAESLGYDAPSAAATIRYFAGWADKLHGETIPVSGPYFTYTRPEPVGVCGQIIPWNFPMPMAAWKLGPALAAGCTVVLKPAEQTPLTALRMGELALEADLPPGVVNVLPGFGADGAGAALVAHPLVDKIAFTGEYTTAQAIRRETADSMKRLSFELGGKSPNIVFDDVDLDDAVGGALGAVFLNMGQNCCAGSRVFVQAGIYDSFVEQLASRASARRIGDPFEPGTEHGPQIDRQQFDKILHYVDLGKKQGARCVTGGERVFDRGYFVEPTVLADVTDDMRVATDEIFGPVASVLRFEDLDNVIERANHTMFGLAAAVWTRDIARAHTIAEQVRAGTVWVNCYNIVDPAAPFGGFKMSGIGRELGAQAIASYTENKTVTIRKGID